MDEVELRRRAVEARLSWSAMIEADARAPGADLFAVEGFRRARVDESLKRSRDLRRLRNLRQAPWAMVLVDDYEEGLVRSGGGASRNSPIIEPLMINISRVLGP